MRYPFKNTITLYEARDRLDGPFAFNIMVKPVGASCNMDCRYCYYLDKGRIYGGRQPKMSQQLLEKLIREYISANDVPQVTFNWHGGEPLMAGLDFYRKAVELQKKYSDGKVILNTIQTNGTLITPSVVDFFSRNDFLVGISIDGPRQVHDSYRLSRSGTSSFERVLEGIMLLRQAGVRFNTMSAVHRFSEGRGTEVYQFLKHIGSTHMQFMPVFEHIRSSEEGARIASVSEQKTKTAPWSVSSEGFGRFMCDVFDKWIENDVGKCFVSLFEATLANHCGLQPGICAHCATCGGNLVVEHNGDVYPCDHFVYPEYRLGNLDQTSLCLLARSDRQHKFGTGKRNNLPRQCCFCRFLHLCHGECPKHRFDITADGTAALSSLCSGYRLFFEHTEPYMLKLKSLFFDRR